MMLTSLPETSCQREGVPSREPFSTSHLGFDPMDANLATDQCNSVRFRTLGMSRVAGKDCRGGCLF